MPFYFRENPANREEQINVLKKKLLKKFNSIYKKTLDHDTIMHTKTGAYIYHQHGFYHFRMSWIKNKLALYIGDSSVRGFR